MAEFFRDSSEHKLDEAFTLTQLYVSFRVVEKLFRHCNDELLKEVFFVHVLVLLGLSIARLTLKPLILLESIILHEVFEVDLIWVFN